jgi:hypothetical protein
MLLPLPMEAYADIPSQILSIWFHFCLHLEQCRFCDLSAAASSRSHKNCIAAVAVSSAIRALVSSAPHAPISQSLSFASNQQPQLQVR